MVTILRRSGHTSMPWRNGGGVTLEAVREPAGADMGEFDWRLSFAQVTGSGPFSEFAGYDRVIALVEGERMRLTDSESGAVLADLGRFEPFAFAGETPIDSVVTAPGLDVNVMTRRDRCRAEVQVHHLPAGETYTLTTSAGRNDPDTPDGGECLVVVLAGAVHVGGEAPGVEGALTALDVVREVGRLALTAEAAPAGRAGEPDGAVVAVVRIHRV